MPERIQQPERDLILDSISSPEETAQLYQQYRTRAGDKLTASLIEANVVLTIGGMRPQTEFFVDEPNEQIRATIESLNQHLAETGVFFKCGDEFDAPDGKRTLMVNVVNLKSLEKATLNSPIPELPRYAFQSGVDGVDEWQNAAEVALNKLVSEGKLPDDVDTLITGFAKGYPWIASLDCASFPPGYGGEREEHGVADVKIPHAHMYGGALPEFDVKKEHRYHPSVLKTQQQWEGFLKKFYESAWHKQLRTSAEFLIERSKKREPDIRDSIAESERVGPIAESVLQTLERVSLAQRRFFHRIKSRLGLIHSVGWSEDQFDVADALKTIRGPIVEVGGPTPDGFRMIHKRMIAESGKQYLTTNVTDGLYQPVGENPTKVAKMQSVDIVADIKHLPFADRSMGAVFASCLPMDIRADAMLEARRVLEDGGLLVWQGTFSDDFEVARRVGFEVVAYEWEIPSQIQKILPANLDLKDIDAVIQAMQKATIQKDMTKQVGEYEHMYAPRNVIFRKMPIDNVPVYPAAGLYDVRGWTPVEDIWRLTNDYQEKYRGLLERKRLIPRTNGGVPDFEVFKEVRTIADDAKKYPGFVSIGIGGSRGMGYALTESDVDAMFLYDSSLQSQTEAEGLQQFLNDTVVKSLEKDSRQLHIESHDIGWMRKEGFLNVEEPYDRLEVFSILCEDAIGPRLAEYRQRLINEMNKLEKPVRDSLLASIVDKLVQMEVNRLRKVGERVQPMSASVNDSAYLESLRSNRSRMWEMRVKRILKQQ